MDNRDENFELRITDTILYGNRADYRSGGAICMYIHYNQNNGNVTNKLQMKNTMIYGNIADDRGRVVYIYNYVINGNQHFQFEMHNCTAYSNRADDQGGVVYLYNENGQNLNFKLKYNCLYIATWLIWEE